LQTVLGRRDLRCLARVEILGVLRSGVLEVRKSRGETHTYLDVLKLLARELGPTVARHLLDVRSDDLRVFVDNRPVEALDDEIPLGAPEIQIVLLSSPAKEPPEVAESCALVETLPD
jgi:hypothetical protein